MEGGGEEFNDNHDDSHQPTEGDDIPKFELGRGESLRGDTQGGDRRTFCRAVGGASFNYHPAGPQEEVGRGDRDATALGDFDGRDFGLVDAGDRPDRVDDQPVLSERGWQDLELSIFETTETTTDEQLGITNKRVQRVLDGEAELRRQGRIEQN